jgi:hypothetical protein
MRYNKCANPTDSEKTGINIFYKCANSTDSLDFYTRFSQLSKSSNFWKVVTDLKSMLY